MLGFKLTILVVIGTNCIGSCKSNYHTIMATMTPVLLVKDNYEPSVSKVTDKIPSVMLLEKLCLYKKNLHNHMKDKY